MRETRTHVEDVGREWLITVTTTYRRWWRRKAVVKVTRYRGSGGSWHRYPSGDRCGTLTSLWLIDIVKADEWKREDAERAAK